MGIKYTRLDSFTPKIFGGNQVVVIETRPNEHDQLESKEMQAIAAEFNVSETAFLTSFRLDSAIATYSLRWFTPTMEVKLCGHGTLGAARKVFEDNPSVNLLRFQTLAGILEAKRCDNGRIEIVLPAGETEPLEGELKERVKAVIREAFGESISVVRLNRGLGEIWKTWIVVEVSDEMDLRGLKVNAAALEQLAPYEDIAVTMRPSSTDSDAGLDFISRLFSPLTGIPEDPVTGSMHCLLAPYWTRRLWAEGTLDNGESKTLRAAQVSQRRGEMDVIWYECDHVCHLRGNAVIVGRGELL